MHLKPTACGQFAESMQTTFARIQKNVCVRVLVCVYMCECVCVYVCVCALRRNFLMVQIALRRNFLMVQISLDLSYACQCFLEFTVCTVVQHAPCAL